MPCFLLAAWAVGNAAHFAGMGQRTVLKMANDFLFFFSPSVFALVCRAFTVTGGGPLGRKFNSVL